MSTAKKKRPSYVQSKHKEEVNKRALVWIGAVFAVIVIAVAVLLIVQS